MKPHEPEFMIDKRGKKTKYYTCVICRQVIVATTKVEATKVHNRILK